MAEINWGALNQTNPFAQYVEGREVGAAMRQKGMRDKAYNIFATDPAQAEQILMQAGDIRGANAIHERRELERQRAVQADVAGRIGQNDYAGAQQVAVAGGEYDLASTIRQMGKEQREQVKEQMGVLAAALYPLRDLPPDQAAQRWAQIAPSLSQRYGYKPEDLNLDFSQPGVIDQHVAEALGVKEMVEQGNEDRNFGLKQDQFGLERERFGETRRHNRATEAVSRGQLGVAQSNAQRGWAAHNARAAAGGYGTPGVGSTVIADDDVEIDP
ncbi:hypothetical protein [Phenylobacterium deserti]|uniref:Uncharacterized protein n=1 Tax=Phenylobacterium deserti TaxID=1914756 RepID=A0A328ABW8_9CAUL|nr:hypothetical protein [Phenylobacterium deserti]RAK52140.1 hypothetical protein DJ018_13370 [Phenylobacterium deserti]